MRISDWSSDVCSSDLVRRDHLALHVPDIVEEHSRVPTQAIVGQFCLQAKFEGVLFFLIERTWRSCQRRIAEIITAAAEAFCPVTIEVGLAVGLPLEADKRHQAGQVLAVVAVDTAASRVKVARSE